MQRNTKENGRIPAQIRTASVDSGPCNRLLGPKFTVLDSDRTVMRIGAAVAMTRMDMCRHAQEIIDVGPGAYVIT